MTKKKRVSKRVPLKRKYNIQKWVKEHNRKIKKAAKKNPLQRKKLKKDPGIPNLWPFKQELLEQLKTSREQEKADKEAKKTEKKARKLAKTAQSESGEQDMISEETGASSVSQMTKLQLDALQKASAFESKQELLQDKDDGFTKSVEHSALSKASKRAYYREFKKVVEAADVILEVLDVRDPLGCRCPDIEKSILSQYPNKKIVLLLNKIDLVPREVVQKWLEHLRRDFPTIAFKSSTQKQKGNIGRQESYKAENADDFSRKSALCLGAGNLIQLLKNYCRSADIKKTISVGIIGYPNVGKSSVINSLTRTRVATVGSTPGVTRAMQEIHLDQNIKLLDCPGIIFSSSQNLDADIILRNAVRVEQLEDAVAPVEQLLTRCKKERLMTLYKIPDFSNTEEFLTHVAKQRGLLKKGGIPRLNQAGKVVLKDWNSGRIKYFTLPPAVSDSFLPTPTTTVSSNSDWANIDCSQDLANIATLKEHMESDAIVPMASSTPGIGLLDVDVESDDEDVDETLVSDDDEIEVEDDSDDDDDEQ